MADYLSIIAQAVLDGDEKLVTKTVTEAMNAKITADDILNKGLIPGVQALGQRFKDGEAYLPEILISTRAMKSGVDKLKPYLGDKATPGKGTVVIGTVEGDMHDIGKNLVKLMLESNGFKVHDLGVDVPSSSFVKAARETSADIVALSALLTTTRICIPDIVKAFEQAKLRDNVKIMIGGAPITRTFADEMGVEGYADDCASAVDEAERLMKSA